MGSGVGGNGASAVAVNNSGDAVGSAPDYVTNSSGYDRAVLWLGSGTSAIALPRLPGGGGGVINRDTIANAINDSRVTVGVAKMYSGSQQVDTRAVRWSADGSGIIDLGSGIANGINNAGDVVGSSSSGATLWTGETNTMLDLNTLIAPDSGWFLLSATDISNTGIIIGQGRFDSDGGGPVAPVTAQFRLAPVPEPGGTLGVAMAGWFLRRRRRRQSAVAA
jgi:hypothetical protein